jgi:hypothetical protein
MKSRIGIAVLVAVALGALAGCSGLYLGDNPGRDVAKETGPLTALPAHLKDGSKE